ncbi:MAG TPA: sporulation integral membrane protein YtvI [Clostridiales bacterium]|nr:sporulation integral membrane protein YtvI [Clostridiales bacterium]
MEQPLSWRERWRLWGRLSIRGVLLIAVLLVLYYAAPPLVSLFYPFLLALVVAWLLNPLVRWLQRKLAISRKSISMVVLLLLFAAAGGVLFGLGWALITQIRALFENWETLRDAAASAFNSVSSWLDNLLGGLLPHQVMTTGEDITQAVVHWIEELDLSAWVTKMAGQAPNVVASVSSFSVGAVVFLTASYFITADYPRLRFQLAERAPADVRAFGSTVRRLFVEAFGGYIKSQLLLSLGVFVILMVGFFFIGQSYSLLLAAGLAVLDFIPIIGAGTVMVPWAVVDLILGEYGGAVELMVIWGIIALFRRLCEPKILGDQTGLSPILSLVGIYVGMRLGGVLGMVVGPLLLLVFINLGKLGVFRPTLDDLGLAARDVQAMLKSGRQE